MSKKHISLIGVNHKSTPLEVREKIALTGGYEEALNRLRNEQVLEFYLLSTCNRVELLWVAEDTVESTPKMQRFLFGEAVVPEQWDGYSYVYRDHEAVNHLFKVAASLDSLVVGEAQILGQIKEAYRYASQFGCTGPLLNKLLHKAFSVAKRIRSETGIGSAAVSISSAAVELARKIFGNLDDKKVLLIGAGEMAELAAEHLLGQGVKGITVANRTLSRAVDLAQRFNGSACSLEEITEQIETVDIIVSSTGSSELIIRSKDVRPLMKIRRNRPLFFIDIAVPRDLDPELNEIDNVFLYDIDDLSQVVEMNRSERDKEAVKAARIVEEETLKFSRWQEGLTITPTISALRAKADEICTSEVSKTLARMELSDSDRQKVEKLAQAITAKMLHNPLRFLKSESCRKGDDSKIDMVRTVFGLENDDADR
ncbi:MAG: glutamyl-tRNA reductase [Desulfofustis sp.]|nr:glutamyl-tRNA reductase [Desulfofustis sp.]NNK13745.1 glutamyl-tRNA reductase [Desulfofustis sp.]NNK57289.1 glutamyl-tRNA reductase [Desulfofustis sp.]